MRMIKLGVQLVAREPPRVPEYNMGRIVNYALMAHRAVLHSTTRYSPF